MIQLFKNYYFFVYHLNAINACFCLGGLALCLRGSTEERGQIIFDMVTSMMFKMYFRSLPCIALHILNCP